MDRLKYVYEDEPSPDAVGYEISVTAKSIRLHMRGEEGITKSFPFTQQRFDSLLASFAHLTTDGNFKRCRRGYYGGLRFYKGDQMVEKAEFTS